MSDYKPIDDVLHLEKVLDMPEKWLSRFGVYYADDNPKSDFFTCFSIATSPDGTIVEILTSSSKTGAQRKLESHEYNYLKHKINRVVQVINTRKMLRVGEFDTWERKENHE